ncbi:hypothetical protein KXX40_008643, partial [Aspergillus fumigatus]
EELQQLLQDLDKIPPDNLPVDDIHPFSSYETTALTDFISFPCYDGYSPDIPKADGEREAMRKRIEQLEKQNESVLILLQRMRSHMKDVQTWMEQVTTVLRQRLGEAPEPATEHGFNAEDV